MTDPLLPDHRRIPEVRSGTSSPEADVVATRDHDVIRRWAERRQAEPATGEATESGPASVTLNDGGAGIRLNFPAAGRFRPISWEEWFANFDQHELTFVFDNDASDAPLSTRYRIVKAADWNDVIVK